MTMAPTPMTMLAADRAGREGEKVAKLPWETESQMPTPSSPQPHSCKTEEEKGGETEQTDGKNGTNMAQKWHKMAQKWHQNGTKMALRTFQVLCSTQNSNNSQSLCEFYPTATPPGPPPMLVILPIQL